MEAEPLSSRVLRSRVTALGLALLALAACRSNDGPTSAYAPTESVMEALAVLRLHVDDDTYRFPAARDFTGKNIYYASLVRLERLEQIHEEKLRSGHLMAPILFGKGLALERLGEFALAARHYERVGQLESELAEPARAQRAICEELAAARAISPGPTESPELANELFDARAARLEALGKKVERTHYRYVVRQEVERADRERAEYFSARARLDPALDGLALQQHQRLVQRHPESVQHNRHLLDLGDEYAALAHRYVARVPATSLDFDPATFDEYAFGASRLYEAVSQQDGAIEKIEATRKLEAFLAFTLQVHDDKLPTP